jgi:hypothetical protein
MTSSTVCAIICKEPRTSSASARKFEERVPSVNLNGVPPNWVDFRLKDLISVFRCSRICGIIDEERLCRTEGVSSESEHKEVNKGFKRDKVRDKVSF